ncbi:M-phase phosphoprotein 8-like isoform X1 [Carassius carassius]|uniref:M-phase phosphoprotein 8-like isoform X1 n=1 Tax=Carassius carassius TaxID=217509 RepID=UPI00286885F2|nr:M-phase phosphoprotein 8-like isoform X1 [Carassius carassius]
MASGAERAEPGESEQDEEDVYEVERIIDMRVEEGEVLYRVRWKNYSSDDDTWEPEAHLDDCREVLLAYKKALAEMKPKKETGMKLPMKSDLFDADSESDSDKEKHKESPIKKKKKKKKKVEESDDDISVKEKKKKKEKWREDKPLPAPESDEEEVDSRDPSPAPPKKETKKRFIESDDDDAPVTPKKQKKPDRHKDGGKQKKESGEDHKKKKVKSKKEIDTSDEEDEKSDLPSESHTDDTTNTETNDSFKTTTTKTTDKSAKSESGGDLKQAKQKKAKSDLKLQGFKDLIQEKKSKKVEVSTATPKESGANKHKALTSGKSTSKSSRSEEEPDSSDTGAPTSAPKSKVKSKGQEAGPPSQKLSSASSSSSSSTASTAPIKPKEEEPKEEVGEKGGASNLFEKFLLNCEAKDRVPRRQADQNKNTIPKGTGKNDKKTKLSKQSPARKPDSDKAKDGKILPRPGQSPVSMEIDEKQEKGASEMEKSDKSDEPAPKSKEELQREQREEEQRKRKEKMEEDERKRKERIEEEERKKKERIEEAQRERKARLEEAQRLAEEARQERLERKSMAESVASPDSTEDSRWKDKRRRRRDDSESRVFTACDDNQDSQETMERSDKTPDRGPPSLNLGVELKLDWMTLEDFQKHLNGEDENLSPLALTPAELREAVKNGNYLAVKRALSSKEDYNLDQEDSSGMSLTLLAAAGGQDDVLRLLIKKGVKVNARQKNGTTALMHAAEKNFLTTVAILLEAGASVNAQTLGGETALMKACKRGNADVVRLLLEYGADCNILSKHKNTALYYAKLSNNLMIYDLIKDHMQTLSTVAEETIRAYFETRLALLEPVFPLACHRLCEGPDFSMEFNYKPPQHAPGEGSGILLFIFHANFLTEITARLCGPCSVHAVVLNDKFQLPIFLDSHFIYSFSPVQGTNKLFMRLAESPTAKVKLLICAYRVQLQ